MIHVASLYCQAAPWKVGKMGAIMLDVAKTSLRVLAEDLDKV